MRRCDIRRDTVKTGCDRGWRAVNVVAETSAYWTSERMNDAKPRERAKPGGGGRGGAAADWSTFAVPLSGGAYAGSDRQNGKVADPGESLVSVNSYGYQGERDTMYGPYMPAGGEAQALHDSLDQ